MGVMTELWEMNQWIVLNYFVQYNPLCLIFLHVFFICLLALFLGDFLHVHGFSLSPSSSTEFHMLESSFNFHLLFSDFFHVHNILTLWA